MQVLFYMDPFVDMDHCFDDRSFVAKMDLNADFLGRYSKADRSITVYFAALESLLQKRDIRQHLKKSNVQVISIPDKEIKGLLNFHNITINMVLSGQVSQEVKEHIRSYLSRKLENLSPDFVIYWESCADDLFAIFPEAIFLEGMHTGFWRLEQNVDLLYNVSTKSHPYKDVFFEEMLGMELTVQDKVALEEFRTAFKRHVLFQTQINRDFLDPDHKFKHLVLYAGNFPSIRFKSYSGHASNSAFVEHLLTMLPEDCGIVFSKHHLDNTPEDFYLEQNPRVISLSNLRKEDENITLRVLPFVDAVANVYSNIFMPAMAANVPVFTFGSSPNAKACLNTIDQLAQWLEEGKTVPEEYHVLADKILKYIFTHRVNIRFLRNARNSYLYLKKVRENIQSGKKYCDWLPVMATINGYTGQFCGSMLVQNSVAASCVQTYEQTQYETLQGHLLNDKIRNIGFDIFDTLLYRPLMKPTDLFDLLEEDVYQIIKLRSFNFSKTRVLAESLARCGCMETTFDRIYEEFQKATGFDDDMIARIKRLELDMEERMLFPRVSLQDYFHLARQHGKNVFIASDMYLPESFIRSVLIQKGYDLSEVKVFISCEINRVKYNGTLFNYILKNEQYTPAESLFIGDNLKSDVIRPNDLGLFAFHYPKAIDKLKDTKIYNPTVMKFVADANFAFHLALVANKIFDNPFRPYNNNSFINNSSALLGYYVFGPLVMSLTQWIISETKDKWYNKILFSSRDSMVIVDVYNEINKSIHHGSLAEGEYIYLSRTATLPAYMSKPMIMALLSMYNTKLNIADYLEYIFDINLATDKKARDIASKIRLKANDDSSFNLHKLYSFIQLYFDDEDDARIQYVKEYFANIIQDKKVALFDLGTRGTSRDIITDLLGSDIPLYLFRTTRHKCDMNIQSYVSDTQNPYRQGIRLVLPLFYELLLSDALTSTCRGYDKIDGKVVPALDNTEFNKNSLLVLTSQNFMRLFCQDYMQVFQEKIKYINSQTRDLFTLPLSWLCAHTTDTELLLQYNGEDPLWKNSKVSVIAHNLNKQKYTDKTAASGMTSDAQKTSRYLKDKSGIYFIKMRLLQLLLGNNKNAWESTPSRRDVFIYFKRLFYRRSTTRKAWDKGRAAYLYLKKQ